MTLIKTIIIIISHVGGISRKHLVETEGTPKLVTIMARYFVKELVKANLQKKTLWKRKFVRTRKEISLWHKEQSGRRIRNYRYVFSKNNTGVLGIEYEGADLVTNKSDDDWTTFVKKDSDGLTRTGQKLFQLAVESYVYAVLDAQAQTRWPIVGRGAKSLQTQEIFHRLVKDTVTQDDPAKAVADMRWAIKKHERGPGHGNFTRIDTRPLGPDHSQRKGGGLQQRSHAHDKGDEVRLERGRELRETQTCRNTRIALRFPKRDPW